MTTIDSGITHRANGTPPPEVPLSDIDLGSLEFWSWDDDRRDGAFVTLRREAPIAFFDAPCIPGFESGPGHWALTSFDHVHHASRHPEVFSSIPTSVTLSEIDPAIAEFSGSMISLDDPRHLRLRSIVNRAFTPKMVARIEESVRTRAQQLVSDMLANHPDGEADFVESLSGPLPLQIICDMMGIPEADEHKVFHWTSVILGAGDEEVTTGHDEAIQAVLDLAAYGAQLAESRRAEPADDLTSNLVRAEVDGERLSSAEIASFFILLSGAGNETTRNAISHGMVALSRYPDARDKWWADFDGVASTAVEEIVRYVSPVISFFRTATKDTELRGTRVKKGERAAMFYPSANRDETHFADPDRFDVSRTPNPHVAFGGGGTHFCLGANLARVEAAAIVPEVLSRMKNLELAGPVERMPSTLINGIHSMPVRFTPARRRG